ncbi:unnamed protein product [Nezara viridula]|uniref:Uncharacterized protein n=1 Tax=Nezara viridula TaxID=85310 RepID=A0A9P0HMC7_NEZVI|nr:unnamed protein product [Nezara viridula]
MTVFLIDDSLHITNVDPPPLVLPAKRKMSSRWQLADHADGLAMLSTMRLSRSKLDPSQLLSAGPPSATNTRSVSMPTQYIV